MLLVCNVYNKEDLQAQARKFWMPWLGVLNKDQLIFLHIKDTSLQFLHFNAPACQFVISDHLFFPEIFF